MTNDELKALYEEFPWAWDAWYSWKDKWYPIDKPSWLPPPCMYQLKPKLLADLPEPTEDMMNRAVYLGRGPFTFPDQVRNFSGWRYDVALNGGWSCLPRLISDSMGFYCIDIHDENAREIIALNAPDRHTNQSGIENRAKHSVTWSAETEEAIVNDLIRQGWTPPGESQWLRLDECEWEEMDRQHTDRKGNDLWETVSFERAILVMHRHGPASVRVRRKN